MTEDRIREIIREEIALARKAARERVLEAMCPVIVEIDIHKGASAVVESAKETIIAASRPKGQE